MMSTHNNDNGDSQGLLFQLPAVDRAVRVREASKRNPGAGTGSADVVLSLCELAKVIQTLVGRIAAVESILGELHSAAAHAVVKRFYSTQEAAKLLGKRPYTVREWCRLGRVRAEKTHAGRGLDEEWRISHDELVRIQNEGLLPLEKFSQVAPPRRLPR